MYNRATGRAAGAYRQLVAGFRSTCEVFLVLITKLAWSTNQPARLPSSPEQY